MNTSISNGRISILSEKCVTEADPTPISPVQSVQNFFLYFVQKLFSPPDPRTE